MQKKIARKRIARNATPPTVPPTMAPTLLEEERLLFVTGTSVVGVTTVVRVLETTTTEPPGSVEEDWMTVWDVEGGKVEMELEVDELVLDGGGVLITPPPPPPPVVVQLVPKSVAVALVRVTGTVTSTGTCVVTTCSAKRVCWF